MRRMTSLLIATVCFSLAGLFVAQAGELQSHPYTGSREFERMKQLVGTWEGTSDMGKEGETTSSRNGPCTKKGRKREG